VEAMALSSKAKWTLAALACLGVLGISLLIVIAVLFFRPFGSVAGSATSAGSVQLGQQVQSRGLVVVNQHHDGATEPSTMGGLDCHAFKFYPGRPELYAYFKVDPGLKQPNVTNQVMVEVEYFDGDAGGHFRLDYDSFNETTRNQGAYTQSKEKVYLKGTQRWRKARFLLDDARFEGRQNDEADFRVTVVGTQFYLRTVVVARAE
jgi:hypothetical protein